MVSFEVLTYRDRCVILLFLKYSMDMSEKGVIGINSDFSKEYRWECRSAFCIIMTSVINVDGSVEVCLYNSDFSNKCRWECRSVFLFFTLHAIVSGMQ